MSTWFYLACLDHDPPLVAEGESGQHHYDLPQIRYDIANRESLVRVQASGHGGRVDFGHHFRNNTAGFLAAHPKCQIGIRDEYGRNHSTEPEGDA